MIDGITTFKTKPKNKVLRLDGYSYNERQLKGLLFDAGFDMDKPINHFIDNINGELVYWQEDGVEKIT